MQIDLLWPTFAMVAVVFAVWISLFIARFGHMRRNPPKPEDFATGEAAMRYFTPVEMPANNFRNIFEMPVLFFALVPLLIVTHHSSHIQVWLAWGYVILRAIHSIIHIMRGLIKARFSVYLLSCILLSAMWIGFALDIAAGR